MTTPKLEDQPHAFSATRKGTPIGVRGTWAHHCDECGRGPNDPVHAVSDEENFASLLRAIEGKES